MSAFPFQLPPVGVEGQSGRAWKYGACALIFLFLVGLTIPGWSGTGWAESPQVFKAVVLVSQDIRPYLQAADGFERELKSMASVEIDRFTLDEERKGLQDPLRKKIGEGRYDLLFAVGPEAMSFLWNMEWDAEVKKVYSMVLNPSQVVSGKACGIPLNIPMTSQMFAISRAFPSLHRLGILYDPQYNSTFVEKAREEGISIGVEIVPLPVSSKKEISAALDLNLRGLDGLWLIPDATVISESLVEFIIKSALYKNVPVIGYNRFFYKSGAALSFILDYEESGEAAARLSLELLSGKACGETSPPFQTWLNLRVVKALGIKASRMCPPASRKVHEKVRHSHEAADRRVPSHLHRHLCSGRCGGAHHQAIHADEVSRPDFLSGQIPCQQCGGGRPDGG
jgi:putative tryptophan/tyrosine transport system substrate-binding protein